MNEHNQEDLIKIVNLLEENKILKKELEEFKNPKNPMKTYYDKNRDKILQQKKEYYSKKKQTNSQ
jgi:hypothetical protein